MQITRSSILNTTIKELGVQVTDGNKPLDTINLVYPVNLKYATLVKSTSINATGSQNVYTTPTTKDFYVTHLTISFTKNAACDCTNFGIYAQVLGASQYLIRCGVQTTTANDSINQTVSFPYPIKIDRNSSIVIAASWGAGAATLYGCISGFIEE